MEIFRKVLLCLFLLFFCIYVSYVFRLFYGYIANTVFISSRNIDKMTYEEVIREIKTPKEAEKYVIGYLSGENDQEVYHEIDYHASFKHIHEKRKDDCDGGALAAAALLSDNGYEPIILFMTNFGSINGHAVYIYKNQGKWGTLGINLADCRKAKYDSIDEVVSSYGFDKYWIIRIDHLYPDWIDNDMNMDKKVDIYIARHKANEVKFSSWKKIYKNIHVKELLWWL